MISSYNEWDTLKQVVVGDATYANWPRYDPVFSAEAKHTLWKETPLPQGPVPQWIIDEANEDLQDLADTLTGLGVDVLRPTPLNFQTHDGLYNYCPRDRLIVHGSTVINPAMMYPCRDMELQCYHDIVDQAVEYHFMPRNEGMVLDAANVLRLGPDKMLFLESASGNRAAYDWLCKVLPTVDIELCNFYAGVHIDSTIVALNEDLFLVNQSRITDRAALPRHLQNKNVIFQSDVVAQTFHEYPYASKWIALNMLSIDPKTVIVDADQLDLIKRLEDVGMDVIPKKLRHSRTLGGGFHCVTLDLVRG
jgi:scyllo-inosamine-4-phosphate amidinotransferase 1